MRESEGACESVPLLLGVRNNSRGQPRYGSDADPREAFAIGRGRELDMRPGATPDTRMRLLPRALACAVFAAAAGCASLAREPGPESEVEVEYLAPRPLENPGDVPSHARPDDGSQRAPPRAPEPGPPIPSEVPGARHLGDLHPALRSRALLLFQRARAEGIEVTFIFGYTPYVPRKRTGPGGWATWHQFGLAFDLNLADRRDLADGRRHFTSDAPRWQRLGAIAGELGLAWGGAWRSSYDPFHFEWHPGDDSVISKDDLRRFLALAGPRAERFREVWPLYPEPRGAGPPGAGPASSPAPNDAAPTLVLAFGGDVAFPRGKNDAALEAIGPRAFDALAPWLAPATLRFANLEAPFTERAPTVQKPFAFTAPPARLAWVLGAGFNLLSLANNHIADAGPAGVADTIAALTRARDAAHGALWWAGADPRAAPPTPVPLVFRAPGTDLAVAFLAFGNGYARQVTHWAGPAAEAAALASVRLARTQAQLVIVSVHGGSEYTHAPDPAVVRLLRGLADAGADIVVGHHAHVVRGIERRGPSVIFYGLGNLAFGSITDRHRATGATLYGMLARVDVSGGKVRRVRVLPLWVDNADPLAPPDLAPLPPTPFSPQPLRGAYAAHVLAAIDGFSALVPGNTTRFGPPAADAPGEGVLEFPE